MNGVKGHQEHTELVCSKEQHTFQDHGSGKRLIEWRLIECARRFQGVFRKVQVNSGLGAVRKQEQFGDS